MAKTSRTPRGNDQPQTQPEDAAPNEDARGLDASPPDQSDAFDDQREVDPDAVSGVEGLRTVALLQASGSEGFRVRDTIQVLSVERSSGGEVTIYHARRLESELTHGQAESRPANTEDASLSLAEFRELVWVMGPARKPRSAIIGRAMRDLNAIDVPSAQTILAIAGRIEHAGPHHLRPEVLTKLVRVRTTDYKSSDASKAMASLLQPGLAYLNDRGWLQLRAKSAGGGAYLQGQAIEIFDQFPPWDRLDEEPARMQRPAGPESS